MEIYISNIKIYLHYLVKVVAEPAYSGRHYHNLENLIYLSVYDYF